MIEGHTVVYKANGWLEAEIIRIFLEANGIPARISQESAGTTLGLTVGPLGTARIYVPTNYVEQAVQLLNDMQNSQFELMEDEPLDQDALDKLSDEKENDAGSDNSS